MYKYIKFTGDYSKLKGLGFEFQRLYASNYMQWSKLSAGEWSACTRVWKKGAEVTLDDLTNFEGPFIELYLEYKARGEELPWHTYSGMMYKEPYDVLRVITNREGHTVSFDYNLYIEQTKRLMDDPESEYNLCSVVMGREQLAMIDKFYELGWIELGIIEND